METTKNSLRAKLVHALRDLILDCRKYNCYDDSFGKTGGIYYDVSDESIQYVPRDNRIDAPDDENKWGLCINTDSLAIWDFSREPMVVACDIYDIHNDSDWQRLIENFDRMGGITR